MTFEWTSAKLHLPGPSTTIADFLLSYPKHHRTSEGLLCSPLPYNPSSVSTQNSISLDDVRDRANKLAEGLTGGRYGKMTLELGDGVILMSRNRHDYISTVLGICLAGGRAILCEPTLCVDALVSRIQATGAKFIIASKAVLGEKSEDGCMGKAESASQLLQDLAPIIIEYNQGYEGGGTRKHESEKLLHRRKGMKGSDIGIVCFRGNETIEYSHNNLKAAVIQMTFCLRDMLNQPLFDWRERETASNGGQHDTSEEQQLADVPKPSPDFLRYSQYEQARRGDSFKERLRGPNSRHLGSLRSRKSALRIKSRPEGQKEFHIDHRPPWAIAVLLLCLSSLHTVSQCVF
jgi:hypothetical protein